MLPSPLQDHSMFMEVAQATWRSVLVAAGEQARFAGMSFSAQDLAKSLAELPPGTELFSALELIQELGTEDARHHLEQVAEDQKLKFSISSSDTPAREFVAQLWLQGRTDAAIRELLLRAQLTQRSVGSLRAYREFVGGGSATDASIDEEKLKAEVSKWCRENQKSEVISVVAQHYNGEWYCHVVRGDPIKRVIQVLDQSLLPLQYRPAATDLLRYDPKTGRIGIATRSSQLLKAYRGVLGTLIAGDDQFFGGENVCSLRPLQDQGNKLFKTHRVPGIFRVDVVELLWRRGERDKLWVGGQDCFQILDDLQAKLCEGELIETKLRVDFAGGGRSGHVTLKVPNIIEIKAGPHQALVERLLDAAGLRGSFNDDGTPRNFWSLHPWRLKEAEWRRRLGAESFDALRARAILRAISLEAVDHPDHPSASRALEVIEAAPGTAIGVSADPAIGVRSVTSSDVEGYQLEILALAEEVQKGLALQGSCREIVDGSGLWSLGQRTFGPGMTMAVFLAAREPGAATAALVSSAAGSASSVMLVPQCCINGSENLASVGCRLPQGPHDALLESVVTRLKWQDAIPPSVWASGNLIIDTARGVVSYCGIELTKLQAGTHPFKFAVAVVKAQGRIVTTQALNDQLSPNRPDNDAAKTAKRDFLNAVKAAFKAIGLTQPSEEIFGSAPGGYFVKTSARVIP